MFTVKHVERNGDEQLFEATDVHRNAEGRIAFGQVEKQITTGRVYIMNDSGQTVAIYDFDKKK